MRGAEGGGGECVFGHRGEAAGEGGGFRVWGAFIVGFVWGFVGFLGFLRFLRFLRFLERWRLTGVGGVGTREAEMLERPWVSADY